MQNIVKRNKYLLFLYRIVNEIIDIKKLLCFIPNYIYYFITLYKYMYKFRTPDAFEFSLLPQIHDRTEFTKVDPHYFYQGYWAFKRIIQRKPDMHYDIGSQIDFVRYLSTNTRVTFIDIRPIDLQLENLFCSKGSILSIPCADSSIFSISSLHVIEHIGLGRYGDHVDAAGCEKAAAELTRILAPGGRLYISTPVGRPRVCFNAHIIRTPRQVVNLFPDLMLKEFSVVDDSRSLVEHADINSYDDCDYACGLFIFSKGD